MRKYTFDLLHSTISNFKEKDRIIPAQSLDDAIRKFAKKHGLEMPAYWDEPSFDTQMELAFKSNLGDVKYLICW